MFYTLQEISGKIQESEAKSAIGACTKLGIDFDTVKVLKIDGKEICISGGISKCESVPKQKKQPAKLKEKLEKQKQKSLKKPISIRRKTSQTKPKKSKRSRR